jgi:dTDP-4-amino-4,6-dideoxygalactose transaminase
MNGYQIAFTGLDRQYKILSEQILERTHDVFASGQLMLGKYTKEFEYWLEKKNQQPAVTCHSGTQALEIVAEWYKKTYDGIVYLPSFTFIATKNAFKRVGCKIRYIDVDDNGILDVAAIRASSEDMICIVGLYGAALDPIDTPAIVLEDGAQHWLSNNCNRIGDITTISFDPMKNLPCYGNGGAIVSKIPDLIEFAKKFRHHHHPEYTDYATNSKMSELDCALMLIKTQYIDEWQKRRVEIAEYWIDKIDYEIIAKDPQTNAFQKFVIKHPDRNRLQNKLKSFGIDTRVNYSYTLSNTINAEKLSKTVLSIPIYPELTDDEVDYIGSKLC